eukprot:CAMPEP_0113882878 /NCGR_PEP_ID=MMETSP0780_2-20120614/9241_1 /TAXON_ID=652834 /ORGANISM="Palpitomonas bilix" /LENGTH=170 /DNA_ID=CAMNT_0000870025 /DNA_START=178 /DNA_END=690 /DNA_ORIENTATION=- /assembly_acc=CAM_ASM_000599
MGIFQSKSSFPPLETVKEVDIDKYIGKWYEIGHMSNIFQPDNGHCVTATYGKRDDGRLSVLNQTRKGSFDAPVKQAKAVAWVPNPAEPGKLKVKFFLFPGDYYILELDEDYKYALIGGPSRRYLWILSRTPQLEQSIIDKLLKAAEEKHQYAKADLDKLCWTKQKEDGAQ